MSSGQNKKGFEMGLSIVVGAVLLFLAGGLIIYTTNLMAQEVKEKEDEGLCRWFNEFRFGLREKNPLGTPIGPEVCRTIHKEIPSDDYEQTTEGVKEEIRDLMVRCWWMWLEGTEPDMLGEWWKKWGKNPCFVCYTFTIKKDRNIETFSFKDLEKSLIEAYYVEDSSDKCAPQGGGRCFYKKCVSKPYIKKVPSTKCEKDHVCCVSEEPLDECINKGGMCLDECGGDYLKYYSKWSCAKGKCCVKDENYQAFLDYIQGDGTGKILFTEGLEFIPQEKIYVINFISPSPKCRIGCILGLGGEAVGTTALVYGTLHIPVIGLYLAPKEVKLGAAAMAYTAIKLSDINDINSLLVTEHMFVEDKCAAQYGED